MNGNQYAMEATGRPKFPHAWFWPIAIVSCFGVISVFAFADPTLSLQKKKEAWAAAVFWQIGEYLLLCAFTHRLWKKLQDGETEITPGKAAGFLFIPFFQFYWLFQVWAGYATALNKFFDRHDIPLRASKGITVIFTITWLLGRLLDWTPVGRLLALVGWVMEMVFVAHTGKLTSNLAGLTAPAAGMKKCPFCAEWIRAEALLCRYCRCSFATAEGEQQLAEANLPVAAVPYRAEAAQVEMDGPEWKGNARERE